MSAALDDRPADVLVEAPTQADLERAHANAIDELACGNHDLAAALGIGLLPHTASQAEGVKFYGGNTPKFRLWRNWRNSARAIATWDALRSVNQIARPAVRETHGSIEFVGPDEAVGLPTADGAPDDQPRLGLA